jgi:hypothetical protein
MTISQNQFGSSKLCSVIPKQLIIGAQVALILCHNFNTVVWLLIFDFHGSFTPVYFKWTSQTVITFLIMACMVECF